MLTNCWQTSFGNKFSKRWSAHRSNWNKQDYETDSDRNMTETKKDFKYSLRQCRKNAEMHKANGLAAALQADKSNKSFWQKVNNKNRSSSLPTLVGGANGGSEIVKMWKDYFKGMLNSETLAMGLPSLWNTAQTARRTTWVLKCPCVLLSPWQHFFKSCPWTKLQGLIVFLQSTCCMQMNLCVFFSLNCLTCVLFTDIYPIPV